MEKEMKKSLSIAVMLLVLVSCSKKMETLDKAKAFIEIKRYDSAIQQAELAIQENPKNAEAHVVKGQAHLLGEDFGDAEKDFSTAILLNKRMRRNIAKIYFDAGITATETSIDHSKYFFNKAKKIDSAFGNKISEMFVDQFFKKIEIIPNINSDILETLNLAVEYSDPKNVQKQKEMIAKKLFDQALQRKDKGLIESSSALIMKAIELNPFIQKKAMPAFLELGYQAIDQKKENNIGRSILNEAKRFDESITKNEKFIVYYNIMDNENLSDNDAAIAENFVIQFKDSQYNEDVLFKLVQYHFLNLDMEKAKFYITKLKTDFSKTKYATEIAGLENDIEKM